MPLVRGRLRHPHLDRELPLARRRNGQGRCIVTVRLVGLDLKGDALSRELAPRGAHLDPEPLFDLLAVSIVCDSLCEDL
jgi:hypothetical protein